MTSDDFNSNPQNAPAFETTVASVLVGVTIEDVSITSVTDAPSSATMHKVVVALSGIDVSYDVRYNVAAMGGDPNAAYNSLLSQLETSIGNGSFSTALNSNAVALGASSSLQSAVVGAVQSSSFEPVSNDDDDDDKNSSHKSSSIVLIVAIAAGGGGLIVLVLAVLCYWRFIWRPSYDNVDWSYGIALEMVDKDNRVERI